MGYTTAFSGQFTITPKLKLHHNRYLKALATTRRMKRDPNVLEDYIDKLRQDVGLPLGDEGEFYVGSVEDLDWGQSRDKSIISYNLPPSNQPSLWLQWLPSEDGDCYMWDGAEKFYDYVDWLKYVIKNFFDPWGYKLNGQVAWSGEDRSDIGVITITDNLIDIGVGI